MPPAPRTEKPLPPAPWYTRVVARSKRATAPSPAAQDRGIRIDRPGLVEVIADVQHTSAFEALRQSRRPVPVAELAVALGRTDQSVQRSLDLLERAGLVRPLSASKRSRRTRYEPAVEKILVLWDPADTGHRALHARLGQSFERRSAANLAAALPFNEREPVRGYIDRRMFWGHFEEDDLRHVKAIVGMLDLLMARVNARHVQDRGGKASAAHRKRVPRCNYHVSFAIVPIPEEFPPPALVQMEGVRNTPYERRHRAAVVFEALTPRERQVYELLLADHSLAEIGRTLGISRPTVATLAKHCYRKFGVGGRQQLMAVAMGLSTGGPGE